MGLHKGRCESTYFARKGDGFQDHLCSVVTDLGLSPADWSDCLKGCEYIRRLFVFNVYAAFASDH